MQNGRDGAVKWRMLCGIVVFGFYVGTILTVRRCKSGFIPIDAENFCGDLPSIVCQLDTLEFCVAMGKHSSHLNWEALSESEQRRILELFLGEFVAFLESPEKGKGNATQRELCERVSKSMGMHFEARQVWRFTQRLYEHGYLKVHYQRVHKLSDDLKGKFSGLKDVTVVAGHDEDRFAQAAAEDFITRLGHLAQRKKTIGGSKDSLNVGIVSGGTTGAVIRAVTNTDWVDDLRIDASQFPRVRVFALNVCLTVPEHLSGNATILAYQLAEKIRRESRHRVEALPYGLSAPLVVERNRLPEIDEAPQTFDVVRYTEPFRVRHKLELEKNGGSAFKQDSSQLDLVLTGVGEQLPGSEGAPGSIFYNLAKAFDFDMDAIIGEHRVVGDVAFTAIRADGEPVPLRKKAMASSPQQLSGEVDSVEYLFYSAVQLPVLEALARSNDKMVILVARHQDHKYKVPAICASVSGSQHQYASHLIVDETTAEALKHF